MNGARVAELFAGALERSAEDRRRYLDAAVAEAAAADDAADLRREVEALLDAYESAGGILDAPLDRVRAASPGA